MSKSRGSRRAGQGLQTAHEEHKTDGGGDGEQTWGLPGSGEDTGEEHPVPDATIPEEQKTDKPVLETTAAGKYGKYVHKLSEEQLEEAWTFLADNGLCPAREEGQGADVLTAELESAEYVDIMLAISSAEDSEIIKIWMAEGPVTARQGDAQSSPHKRPNGSKSGGTRAPKTETRKVDKSEMADTRVFSEVAPNPKKPGAGAHGRYAHYEVGITVQEFVRRGGTMADVKWDVGHGFVKLVSPEEWAADHPASGSDSK